IRAARTKMSARLTATRITSSADAFFQCFKGMFHPRLANLFEALLVILASAHAIEVLWNDRMIGLRQRKPIDWLVPVVTRVCPYRQTNLCPAISHLVHVFDLSNNNVWAWHQVWRLRAERMLQWRHHHRLSF